MGQAIAVRTDFTAGEVRRLAKGAKDAAQARRLLAIAAVLDGASREDAARIGGMDRQTLHADQSALENHVHRTPRLGRRRSLNLRIGISAFSGPAAAEFVRSMPRKVAVIPRLRSALMTKIDFNFDFQAINGNSSEHLAKSRVHLNVQHARSRV